MKPFKTITCIGGEKVKIDSSDYKRVSEKSWRVTKTKAGRKRVLTSISTSKGPRNITLGKFLMKPPKGKQVYPRRFVEGLDYRKSNLIVCSPADQVRMLPKNRKDLTSKFRGVSFSKSSGKWRASINVKGKSINLGNFATEKAAAAAYNRGAYKHFGEFAYQNNIGRKKIARD